MPLNYIYKKISLVTDPQPAMARPWVSWPAMAWPWVSWPWTILFYFYFFKKKKKSIAGVLLSFWIAV
jgi:hypothetical protein